MVGARGFEPPTSATPFASSTMSQVAVSVPAHANPCRAPGIGQRRETASCPFDAGPCRTTREQFVRRAFSFDVAMWEPECVHRPLRQRRTRDCWWPCRSLKAPARRLARQQSEDRMSESASFASIISKRLTVPVLGAHPCTGPCSVRATIEAS